MTFEELISALADVVRVSQSDTIAAETANKILGMDVTAHNALEIEKLLNSFERNR